MQNGNRLEIIESIIINLNMLILLSTVHMRSTNWAILKIANFQIFFIAIH